MKIRTAEYEDLPAINFIGNQAIRDKFKTAKRSEISDEERAEWFSSCDRLKYPVFVAEENDTILGWLALNPYRKGREYLNESAIVSYFINYDHHSKGIGSALIEYLINNTPEPIRVIFAIIIEGNTASIELLKKFNFEEWARLPQVYNAHGEIKDQLYFGRIMR